MAGEERAVEEILAEVQKDRLFYENSGGGLTLSGGEPLMQAEVCAALLEGAKKSGIHTAVETSGAVARKALELTAPLTDLYLFDYKETDAARHKAFTGADNRRILENLAYLDALGKPIILRCPIIPSCNDREDHYRGIAALANRLGSIREIVIEPYHTLGVGKYARLDKPYSLVGIDTLDRERAEDITALIRELTRVPVTIA